MQTFPSSSVDNWNPLRTFHASQKKKTAAAAVAAPRGTCTDGRLVAIQVEKEKGRELESYCCCCCFWGCWIRSGSTRLLIGPDSVTHDGTVTSSLSLHNLHLPLAPPPPHITLVSLQTQKERESKREKEKEEEEEKKVI